MVQHKTQLNLHYCKISSSLTNESQKVQLWKQSLILTTLQEYRIWQQDSFLYIFFSLFYLIFLKE